MYCCKPREEEYITAGDWVKEYLPTHAILFFFIVPETSGASIKALRRANFRYHRKHLMNLAG